MNEGIDSYAPYASTLVTVKFMVIFLAVLVGAAGFAVRNFAPTILAAYKTSNKKQPKIPAHLRKYK